MANGVYFMASKTSSEEIDIAPLGTVVYDSVSINEGGYYNSDSGIFTCTVPGWYFFHFAAHASQASTWIPELVKKDASGSVSRSAGGFLNDAHTYTSSNGAVLKCAGGDTVMVRNGSDNTGRIRGTDESVGAQQSVFAGFLLEQEF